MFKNTLFGMILSLLVFLQSAIAFQIDEFEIEPTKQAVTEFLKGLEPDLVFLETSRGLIAQLGHVEFEKREAAMQSLIAMPIPPFELLEKAVRSADSETKYRARKILKHPSMAAKRGLIENKKLAIRTVFKSVQENRIKGTAKAIVQAAKYIEDDDVLDLACEAITHAVEQSDLE